MKYSFPGLILFLLVFLGGCVEYKTQYEGPYQDGASAAVTYEILFVENGVMRMANQNLSRVKTLPTASNVVKASINYRHDRIAFKTATGNIMVIDTAGQTLATVTNSNNVLWFDWHTNNETLYMLNPNNTLSFYGPTISVATANPASRIPGYPNLSIKTVAITSNGTVVCGAYSEFVPAESGVWILEPNGQNTRLRTDFDIPTHIRISPQNYYGYLSMQNSATSSAGAFLLIEPGNHFLERLNGSPRLLAPSPMDENEAIGWSLSPKELYLRSGKSKLPVSGVVDDLDW